MSYLDLLKELFGRGGTKIAVAIILGAVLMYKAPQYFVPVPVFAQAMQQMQKQMMIGDSLQEKRWLESEIDRLKGKLLEIYSKGKQNLATEDELMIKTINEDIACKTRRIESINLQMQNNWMKGD